MVNPAPPRTPTTTRSRSSCDHRRSARRPRRPDIHTRCDLLPLDRLRADPRSRQTRATVGQGEASPGGRANERSRRAAASVARIGLEMRDRHGRLVGRRLAVGPKVVLRAAHCAAPEPSRPAARLELPSDFIREHFDWLITKNGNLTFRADKLPEVERAARVWRAARAMARPRRNAPGSRSPAVARACRNRRECGPRIPIGPLSDRPTCSSDDRC